MKLSPQAKRYADRYLDLLDLRDWEITWGTLADEEQTSLYGKAAIGEDHTAAIYLRPFYEDYADLFGTIRHELIHVRLGYELNFEAGTGNEELEAAVDALEKAFGSLE